MKNITIGRKTKISNDWSFLVRSARKHLNRNKVLLDIGASNWERTKDLLPYCKRLIGVELVMERIPNVRKNKKAKIIQGDWQELTKKIPKESIDVVVSNQVLEHVEDDLKAVNELHNVLKLKGVGIICTPNKARLLQRILDIFLGERKFPWGEHVREYTKKDLEELIKKSKFEKYKIFSHTFGIHTGPLFFFVEKVPPFLEKWTNFLEVHLYK